MASPKILKKSKSISNLKKGLIIGGSVLGVSGIIGGIVALVKCLNNKKADSETKPLEGTKKEEVKKLMNNFLNQNWVVDKSSACFCRVAGHICNLVEFPKNLSFDLFEKKENEAPEGLDKWANYHLKEIREIFNEDKDIAKFFKVNGDTEDTKKFEYLIFSCNGRIIKIGIMKDTKKLHDLEFLVYDKNKCNCRWKFLLNSAK